MTIYKGNQEIQCVVCNSVSRKNLDGDALTCNLCLENRRLNIELFKLKEKNSKLESDNEKWKETHENFIDKSKNWHDQQLVQKDEEFKEFSKRSFEEIDYWKNKFENLEKKLESINNNLCQKNETLETKYSELIIKEN